MLHHCSRPASPHLDRHAKIDGFNQPCGSASSATCLYVDGYATGVLRRSTPRRTGRRAAQGRERRRAARLRQRLGLGRGLRARTSIVRVNPTTLKVQKVIHVGKKPWDVNYGAGAVWATNEQDEHRSRASIRKTNKVVKTISIAGAPACVRTASTAVWVGIESEATTSPDRPTDEHRDHDSGRPRQRALRRCARRRRLGLRRPQRHGHASRSVGQGRRDDPGRQRDRPTGRAAPTGSSGYRTSATGRSRASTRRPTRSSTRSRRPAVRSSHAPPSAPSGSATTKERSSGGSRPSGSRDCP